MQWKSNAGCFAANIGFIPFSTFAATLQYVLDPVLNANASVLLRACNKMYGACEENDLTKCLLIITVQPWAVQTAEECTLLHSPEVTAECWHTKLLCRCAEEVETFIGSCLKANWIGAAVVLSNNFERVPSLSSDLEFCTIRLRNNLTKATTRRELAELDGLVKSRLVKVFYSIKGLCPQNWNL